jgi:hypothetical protein
LVDGTTLVYAFTEVTNEMAEIREADNTISIEITEPASSAIELGESTEIRISDPAVSREIRILYPLN